MTVKSLSTFLFNRVNSWCHPFFLPGKSQNRFDRLPRMIPFEAKLGLYIHLGKTQNFTAFDLASLAYDMVPFKSFNFIFIGIFLVQISHFC